MPNKLSALHALNQGQAVKVVQLGLGKANRDGGNDGELFSPGTQAAAEGGVIINGHLELSVDEWATFEVAAMLARVKRVCIMELQWQIDALGRL